MTSYEIPQLAVSTSLSTLSSSSVGFSTPMNATRTLKELYEGAQLTPPAKADQFSVAEMERQVNGLLAPGYWDSLDSIGHAKISFLVMREQHELLSKLLNATPEKVAQAFHYALDMNHTFGKRLDALVRKGGDIFFSDEDREVASCPLATFLSRHKEFFDPDDAPTIFNCQDRFKRVEKPLIWIQENTSTVCYLVTVACAIFYNQCIQNGVTANDGPVAVQKYSLNISRFMRDEFANEEICANIFMTQGGHPDAMMERLLRPQNPNKKKVVEDYCLDVTMSIDLIFANVKHWLGKHGALVASDFKMFPKYVADKTKCVFHGNWNDLKQDAIERELQEAPMDVDEYNNFWGLPPNDIQLHAFLIIGVRRTTGEDDMGGLAFLIQDSSDERPFVIIGLDLLVSAGVERLYAVAQDVTFDSENFCHDRTANPAFIMSGGHSPRIYDIPSSDSSEEENLEESNTVRNFHRYWTPIDPAKISYIKT